ncbi:SDR family NAD(P)-dependent oxidoreductase [Nostoc flagelliforme]|uniref:SDR family NAD(P)-dependent oxidoreductase n=1 Tax=Nostoc flagelliforme TaxID=1306274 RepID=UPI0024118870|nr:SDR family NAD(P)-dependent oxidoreductase [Nostoc flagelliforme]
MDLKLHGKSALVSGSTAGIGLVIAVGLAQEGALVILNGRSEERVNQAIAKIKHFTPDAKVSGVIADTGTALGVEKLFQEVPHVDILINNLFPSWGRNVALAQRKLRLSFFRMCVQVP